MSNKKPNTAVKPKNRSSHQVARNESIETNEIDMFGLAPSCFQPDKGSNHQNEDFINTSLSDDVFDTNDILIRPDKASSDPGVWPFDEFIQASDMRIIMSEKIQEIYRPINVSGRSFNHSVSTMSQLERNEWKDLAINIRNFINKGHGKDFKYYHKIAVNAIIHFDDEAYNVNKPFPSHTLKQLKEAQSIYLECSDDK